GRGSSRSSRRTSRRTARAASSWPTEESCLGPVTDSWPSAHRSRVKQKEWPNMAHGLTLAGRTAVVTGAGNCLGRGEALALAADGARLILNDLPGPAVHAVADEIIGAGGQVVVCEGDVGEWATGESMLSAALSSFGGLDILVNNAGVLRDRMVFTMSPEEWDLVLR